MKVVLIEDNCETCEDLRAILERKKETVFSFDQSTEALTFIEATLDIDVIIVSLNLRDGSGLEICWHSRIFAAQRKAMFVIAISEQSDAEILIEALDSGADDFLHKPVQEEILLARLRVAERVTMLQNQLVQMANHDPLTDLLNRRAFFEKSHRCMARAKKGHPVAAIMFDIDHFKSVNDHYGHDAGDQVIRTVARIASSSGYLLGRLGGEEFAIIIDRCSLRTAARIANRIRQQIEQTPIIVNGHKISITSSFGVAERLQGDDVDALLKRADAALYHSKGNGRNSVTVACSQERQNEANNRSRAV
ncbi:diguanylate cyclase [uncultured Cohaesibacter sp.]|uniref:diguanylate cyclase n=1 Tax=uncultured Cohaesibacter sp. TaxID=1002546 RepID=UPI00293028FF|nr:diguanylate cyclase [uncultured Cohaesibacter sp.]